VATLIASSAGEDDVAEASLRVWLPYRPVEILRLSSGWQNYGGGDFTALLIPC